MTNSKKDSTTYCNRCGENHEERDLINNASDKVLWDDKDSELESSKPKATGELSLKEVLIQLAARARLAYKSEEPIKNNAKAIEQAFQAINAKYITKEESDRRVLEARIDEVANCKIAHIDMHHGDKGEFDSWCTKRQEDIDNGKLKCRFE